MNTSHNFQNICKNFRSIELIDAFTYDDIYSYYSLNSEKIINTEERNIVVNKDKYKKEQSKCLTVNNLITETIFKILDTLNPEIIKIKDFFNTTTKCFTKLIEKIVEIYNNDNSSVFYFYLGENFTKSNFWMCNLFIHILESSSHKNHIKNNIFFFDEIIHCDLNNQILKILNHDINKNNIFVYLDDCSYSGRQLDKTIHDKRHDIFNKNKTKIIVALPYISEYAIKFLNQGISDIIFINEKILSTIGMNKILVRKLLSLNLFIVDKNSYYCDLLKDVFGFLYLLYIPYLFEHKMADGISIPQYMYNYLHTYAPPIGQKYLVQLNDNYIDQLMSSVFNSDNTININNIDKMTLSQKKIILEEIELYELNIEQYNIKITLFDSNTINEECNKNIGILDNCSQSYYEKLNNGYYIDIDYEKDDLCYKPIYSFVPKISQTLKNIWNKKINNDDNENIINNFELI